jgi:thioredoxin reductase (NADPH)
MMKQLQDSKTVEFLLPSDIVEIQDSGGKPRVVFSPKAQLPRDSLDGAKTFDAVLYGLGGMTPLEFLRTAQVPIDDLGNPLVSETKETPVPGLYVVGDLLGKAKGGGSIIAGFNSANTAAYDLLQKYFHKETPAPLVSLDHLRF